MSKVIHWESIPESVRRVIINSLALSDADILVSQVSREFATCVRRRFLDKVVSSFDRGFHNLVKNSVCLKESIRAYRACQSQPRLSKLLPVTITNNSSPSARFAHSAIVDASNGKIVIFGGRHDPYMFNDTWSFDPKTAIWTNLDHQAIQEERPAPRRAHSAHYRCRQGRHNEMLIIGGGNAVETFGDVWLRDLDNKSTTPWQLVTSSLTPNWKAFGHASSFFAQKYLLVHGGARQSSEGFNALDDILLFEFAKDTAPELMRIDQCGEPPSPCYRHSLTLLDQTNKNTTRFVMFGGYTVFPVSYPAFNAHECYYCSNDIYVLDLLFPHIPHDDDRPYLVWTSIETPLDMPDIPVRGGHAAVRLSPDKIMIFGGGIQVEDHPPPPINEVDPFECDLSDIWLLSISKSVAIKQEISLPFVQGGQIATLTPFNHHLGIFVFGGRDYRDEGGVRRHLGRNDTFYLPLFQSASDYDDDKKRTVEFS